MATRLSWWTIPATIVVLVRVVTLPSSESASVEAKAPTVASSAAGQTWSSTSTVVLRDAAGMRSEPFELKTDDALVLQLPVASQRVDFTLRRYLPDQNEPSLWLHGSPRVRADGTMPILGLPLGRYAVELVWTEAGEQRRIVRDDLVVPGTFDLRQ